MEYVLVIGGIIAFVLVIYAIRYVTTLGVNSAAKALARNVLFRSENQDSKHFTSGPLAIETSAPMSGLMRQLSQQVPTVAAPPKGDPGLVVIDQAQDSIVWSLANTLGSQFDAQVIVTDLGDRRHLEFTLVTWTDSDAGLVGIGPLRLLWQQVQHSVALAEGRAQLAPAISASAPAEGVDASQPSTVKLLSWSGTALAVMGFAFMVTVPRRALLTSQRGWVGFLVLLAGLGCLYLAQKFLNRHPEQFMPGAQIPRLTPVAPPSEPAAPTSHAIPAPPGVSVAPPIPSVPAMPSSAATLCDSSVGLPMPPTPPLRVASGMRGGAGPLARVPRRVLLIGIVAGVFVGGALALYGIGVFGPARGSSAQDESTDTMPLTSQPELVAPQSSDAPITVDTHVISTSSRDGYVVKLRGDGDSSQVWTLELLPTWQYRIDGSDADQTAFFDAAGDGNPGVELTRDSSGVVALNVNTSNSSDNSDSLGGTTSDSTGISEPTTAKRLADLLRYGNADGSPADFGVTFHRLRSTESGLIWFTVNEGDDSDVFQITASEAGELRVDGTSATAAEFRTMLESADWLGGTIVLTRQGVVSLQIDGGDI